MNFFQILFFSILLHILPIDVLRICCETNAQQAGLHCNPASIFFSEGKTESQFVLTSRFAHQVKVSLQVEHGHVDESDSPYNNRVVADEEKSCATWVRCDPEEILLSAGDSVVVTLTAEPTGAIQDGEYWGRLFVREITTDRTPGNTVALAELPVTYRYGDSYADVKLADTKVFRDGKSVVIWLEFLRLGNSAYHGNLDLAVRNDKGNILLSQKTTISVYESAKKRFEVASASMPPGKYRITMKFDAERPDLNGYAPLILPKNYTVEIRLP